MNPFTTVPKLIKSKPLVDELEKDLKTMDKKNWKTTILGAIALVLALAHIWAPAGYQGKIQATSGAFAAAGLIAAKDHDN